MYYHKDPEVQVVQVLSCSLAMNGAIMKENVSTEIDVQ
jgi:hypothetical protein